LNDHSSFAFAALEPLISIIGIRVESTTFKSIFNVKALKHALENLNLPDVVRRTIALADDDSPGYAWLDASGQIQFSESPREIDGLVFFEVCEPSSEIRNEETFRIAKWIQGIGLTELETLLRSVLEAETSN
jgi:hypothetical protein